MPPSLDGSETAGTTSGDGLEPGPPKQIGRFTVLGKLGQGGMGVVFLGHDSELERKIAIKLLRSNATQKVGVRRLVREAQGLARLSHPNVIQVHEIGEHEGAMFVAMEYVEGSTLRDWIDAAESRTWRRALDVIRQAGRGLEAAHTAGLVHRDFKPTNVIVGNDGRARARSPAPARRCHPRSASSATRSATPACSPTIPRR
ncbi:MAG TPA: serine/threonine-protein kinase [Enhygromyxa sp.]|nr:serine/threonine-protein kinase [Enhygromyxa sp.]